MNLVEATPPAAVSDSRGSSSHWVPTGGRRGTALYFFDPGTGASLTAGAEVAVVA